MMSQFDRQNYMYILQVENALFMRYKMDPFTMENSMTVNDLQNFMTMLTAKVEEEEKERQKDGNGNKLMKSLAAIRDILNYMFDRGG